MQLRQSSAVTKHKPALAWCSCICKSVIGLIQEGLHAWLQAAACKVLTLYKTLRMSISTSAYWKCTLDCKCRKPSNFGSTSGVLLFCEEATLRHNISWHVAIAMTLHAFVMTTRMSSCVTFKPTSANPSKPGTNAYVQGSNMKQRLLSSVPCQSLCDSYRRIHTSQDQICLQ